MIVGKDAARAVSALVAPGPLELAPTCHYPPGWLRGQRRRTMFGEAEELYCLPKWAGETPREGGDEAGSKGA
jgi:hypothetical protein